MTRSMALLMAALLVVSAAGVPVWAGDRTRPSGPNPYDKFRRQDDRSRSRGALSLQDELTFAEMAHQEISKQYRFVTDPVIVNYVNRVGRRVAEVSGRPDLPYQFYVVQNDQINAFTPGGGRIYIHTGLIKQATTEGQVAAVLAHEVGHNVGYHLSATLRRAQTTGLLVGIAGAILGGGAVGQLGQLAVALIANGRMFQRSRDQEREADFLGLYDMHNAGYNTEEMNNMFRLLGSLMQRSPGAFDKIFASHPPPTERLQNTQREIAQYLAGSDRRGTRTTQEFINIQRRLGVTGRALPPTPDDGDLPPSRNSDTATEPLPSRGREVTYDDAEEIFSRAGLQGVTPLRAVRGDLLGGNVGNDTVIAYERGGDVGALVDVSGRVYPLHIEDRGRHTPILPLVPDEVSAVGIVPVGRGRRAQVVVVSRRRLSYVWEWTGRGFRYLGSQ
ncbi:M48 family metalloprotease [Chloracidobacterium validum]|uniref:M48 family metalloprotease n=1 Tax=Chloracidobacterium validum TaxID=2821543 RepID=A0ABX8B8V2_9BACT|nr:M48 family metallopeptidase [Chloracidobacterium validum]QUW03368.1 M48 family metalloprotease [Chloracidobacterium validum]